MGRNRQLWLFFLTLFTFISAFWRFLLPYFNWPWKNIFIWFDLIWVCFRVCNSHGVATWHPNLTLLLYHMSRLKHSTCNQSLSVRFCQLLNINLASQFLCHARVTALFVPRQPNKKNFALIWIFLCLFLRVCCIYTPDRISVLVPCVRSSLALDRRIEFHFEYAQTKLKIWEYIEMTFESRVYCYAIPTKRCEKFKKKKNKKTISISDSY